MTPTAVQTKGVPLALAGKDLVARARTGSGKTLAYLLPTFHKLLQPSAAARGTFPRALLLVPTRELCEQVKNEATKLMNHAGGSLRIEQLPQAGAPASATRAVLAVRPDVLVATPARVVACLSDGMLPPSCFSGDALEMLVLDEADLLLSYGYEADLKALAARVRQSAMCQVMMLSATLSPEVRCLSQAMLHNPHEVDVAEEEAGADDASAASGGAASLSGRKDLVDHYLVHCPQSNDKLLYLLALLRLNLVDRKVIVFVNTVDAGFRVKLFLEKFGIRSVMLNSELPVNSRSHILQEFNA
eukprot:CAMPEP_0114312126 /NCGR_PEP_ID=MMETSP0059-20121206/20239_1 /TAXON_ID=36894 /ORGANISM="Pyramimonas parkeae, Strain CCMP726" /LENGTH=300 /DNA_ID=CAMNT_0001436441 /DNA_START=60 /DNA_END=959 /DNA_ORIENTATION=+